MHPSSHLHTKRKEKPSRCVLCDVGRSWEARERCSSTSLSSTHLSIHLSIHPSIYPSIRSSVHPSPLLLLACRVWLSQLEDIWTATGGKRAPLPFFLPFLSFLSFLFLFFFLPPLEKTKTKTKSSQMLSMITWRVCVRARACNSFQVALYHNIEVSRVRGVKTVHYRNYDYYYVIIRLL